jgi:hypothetical protein
LHGERLRRACRRQRRWSIAASLNACLVAEQLPGRHGQPAEAGAEVLARVMREEERVSKEAGLQQLCRQPRSKLTESGLQPGLGWPVHRALSRWSHRGSEVELMEVGRRRRLESLGWQRRRDWLPGHWRSYPWRPMAASRLGRPRRQERHPELRTRPEGCERRPIAGALLHPALKEL